MGANYSPPLANLYMHFYEKTYSTSLEITDPRKARAWRNSFRLIDDLLSINNPHVDDALQPGTMYPAFLRMNETTSNDVVTFLGMKIEVEPGHTVYNRLKLRVYDKKDDFPFEVRNYPHRDSNIPRTILRGVFWGQLVRYQRICTDLEGFFAASKKLALRLAKNGFSTRQLRVWFAVFIRSELNRYRGAKVCALLRRWNATVQHIANLIRVQRESS